ncbi:hypothetical protein ES706_04251 [subsurface metagenome]
MKMSFVIIAVLALLAMLAAGCAPQGIPPPTPTPTPEEITPIPAPEPTPTPTIEWGIIEVRVTDPPPADVTSAVVYFENLEAHKVDGGEGEWIPILEEGSFDLMEVVGVTEVLGSVNVTAGSFTQIRMDVEEVAVVFVTDNITDNVTARVPSEKLRIVRPFNVGGGVKTVLTLDFDGEKSLILPGKDIVTGKERAIFKPVVKLLVSGAPVALVSGAPAALEITTTSLSDGEVGTDYTATVEAIGGTGSYTWSISEGDLLPDGLTLDSGTGIIEGNPTTEGEYEFTVEVEDESDPMQSDTQELSITIAAGALEITTTSLLDGEEGTAYTATLEAIGGTEPYTWSISDGEPPEGLELDSDTGVISGTPATAGDYSFTVQVEDSSDPEKSDTQEFSIDIETEAPAALEITTTSLSDGEVGTDYTDTLEATGGTGSYTWSISAGDSLPDGLTLDSGTGIIEGNPTTEEEYEFTVEVEDESDPMQSATQELSITIIAT